MTLHTTRRYLNYGPHCTVRSVIRYLPKHTLGRYHFEQYSVPSQSTLPASKRLMLEMNFWTSVSFASSPTLPLPRIQCCDQTSCVACCTCCTTSDIPSLATLNLGERGWRAERSTHARKVNRIEAYQIWGGGGPSSERQRQGSASMRKAF